MTDLEPRHSLHTSSRTSAGESDLLVLSHLRWDFVYQRPQHLLSRFARERRVFFFEEPVVTTGQPRLDVSQRDAKLWVCTPELPSGLPPAKLDRLQQAMLDQLLVERALRSYTLWYYTPMSLGFTRHLSPSAIVYDCMDELSAFLGAPPQLRAREQELFRCADLVFTGGQSLWEAKREQHPRVYLFPSSIDAAHFGQARQHDSEPADQATIPTPRLGYFGVIDERMDLELIASLADARPDWQIVMIGPVVKIDPSTLPRRANLHWLGSKPYADLPAYIAGWDVALLPFARGPSTRFISPTKIPEYLAAGKPVVSTAIRDVVRPYGVQGLVHIANDVPGFIAAIEAELARSDRDAWLAEVDRFLAGTSWDSTWERMRQLLAATTRTRASDLRSDAAREDAPCSTT